MVICLKDARKLYEKGLIPDEKQRFPICLQNEKKHENNTISLCFGIIEFPSLNIYNLAQILSIMCQNAMMFACEGIFASYYVVYYKYRFNNNNYRKIYSFFSLIIFI